MSTREKFENLAQQANLLKSIVESDSYKKTIGQWLTELIQHAYSNLMNATTDNDLRKMQGGLMYLELLNNRIKSVLTEGEIARTKLLTLQD